MNVDLCFTCDGFRNWKSALDSKKGFRQHASSQSHRNAMKAWEDFKNRSNINKTIDIMFVDKLPEHQAWVEVVFHVVKFLSMNGLPFRGDNENSNFASADFGGGLYLNMFGDLLFPVNPNLKQIAKELPANAKYTSPEIQNKVI